MVNDVEERPIVPAITVFKNDHYKLQLIVLEGSSLSSTLRLSAEKSGAPSDFSL